MSFPELSRTRFFLFQETHAALRPGYKYVSGSALHQPDLVTWEGGGSPSYYLLSWILALPAASTLIGVVGITEVHKWHLKEQVASPVRPSHTSRDCHITEGSAGHFITSSLILQIWKLRPRKGHWLARGHLIVTRKAETPTWDFSPFHPELGDVRDFIRSKFPSPYIYTWKRSTTYWVWNSESMLGTSGGGSVTLGIRNPRMKGRTHDWMKYIYKE